MKRVDLTKREQHVLMTVCRAVQKALRPAPSSFDQEPTLIIESLIRTQPGMTEPDAAIPTPLELESIIERLSDNEVT